MKEFLKTSGEMGEPTKLGEALSIVGHHFGSPVSNEKLLEMAIGFGADSSQIEPLAKGIAATGFTNRYFSHFPEADFDLVSAMERTINIGALILKEAMRSKGWDGVDVFIDTSAFLPENINSEILEKTGLNPENIISKSYRYACAGAVGAFIDTVSNNDLKNARVVVAAIEPLSWLVDKSQFLSTPGIAFPSIFGDSYTAMAFTPGNFTLETKQVLVKSDGGVIKLHQMYDFDKNASEPSTTPSHYRFAENSEEIFSYSEKGAFLDIEKPDPQTKVTMDGIGTGMFFGDNTSKVIVELLHEHGNPVLLKELDGKNMIIHPASKPVVNRIAKLLKRGGYLETPELPFLMDKMGYSNGSSATTLNRFRYMIENDMIDTRLPVFWIAPGIGSAIAGAIGMIKI